MASAATSHRSDWRDGFLFVGNDVALDFLNTCPIQNGEPLELVSDFKALLRWFRAAGLVTPRQAGHLERQWRGSPRARNVTEAMRELRERIRKQVLAWEPTGTIDRSMVDELNRLMSEHPMLWKLQGPTPVTGLWFAATQPEDLFAPIAHSAAMLFANLDHQRVRKCGQCVLHFYDSSKKGTRRWCSMQRCGNRIKVAAYAARQRTGSSR
jgi:predicted RNA-binding Zn ribbon-like protein